MFFPDFLDCGKEDSRMKYIRVMLALAAMATLISCQAAQSLLKLPVNMAKAIGRTVGLNS